MWNKMKCDENFVILYKNAILKMERLLTESVNKFIKFMVKNIKY